MLCTCDSIWLEIKIKGDAGLNSLLLLVKKFTQWNNNTVKGMRLPTCTVSQICNLPQSIWAWYTINSANDVSCSPHCVNNWVYPSYRFFYASSLNTKSSVTQSTFNKTSTRALCRSKYLANKVVKLFVANVNSTSWPTGNQNLCLLRQMVLSEMPRILATSAQRNPASTCKVSNCSWASSNHGLPTSPPLITDTIGCVADSSSASTSLPDSSTIPSKWHRSSFKLSRCFQQGPKTWDHLYAHI